LKEAGGRRKEAGGRRQEEGGRRKEAGGRRQEAGGRRQEAGGRGRSLSFWEKVQFRRGFKPLLNWGYQILIWWGS
jgi:hypothetical protein